MALLGGVVVLSGTAAAFFTARGAGSTGVTVASLGKPSITAANPAAGGTVSLSWNAATAPGEGTVTYYVTRDGGTPAGTCPAAASPAAVTSCTDKAVPVGSHTYVVTALWHSWAAAASPASATVTIGEATHLTLSASATAISAGGSSNLTITAKDVNEKTVTTYAGSKSIVFSGASAGPAGTQPTVSNSSGTAVNFGSATALTFTAGVATVSSTKNGVMKLYRAETASISAGDGTISTASPVAVTVSPAALSKFSLAPETTTPAVAAADDLTITAQDAYSNTVTSYAGAKSLTFSGAAAAPNGTLPTVSDSAGSPVAFGSATSINFVAGVATAAGANNGEMHLYKSGATSIKVAEGAIASATVSVTPSPGSAVKLLLAATTTAPLAGASDNLTVTAQDAYSNTATTYAGSKSIVFSGASAGPAGTQPTVSNSSGTAVNFGTATALTFTAGVATVSGSNNGVMKLPRAESATINAGDGALSTAAGLTVAVSPAAAARIAFLEPSASAGTPSSPCLFTCTIAGLGNSGTLSARLAITDSFGNVVSGIGVGHSLKVTASGGAITEPTFTLPSAGPAETATHFTYTSPGSGSYSNTITAATSAGTVYTSATATATG
jgi:hypothetical protein